MGERQTLAMRILSRYGRALDTNSSSSVLHDIYYIRTRTVEKVGEDEGCKGRKGLILTIHIQFSTCIHNRFSHLLDTTQNPFRHYRRILHNHPALSWYRYSRRQPRALSAQLIASKRSLSSQSSPHNCDTNTRKASTRGSRRNSCRGGAILTEAY